VYDLFVSIFGISTANFIFGDAPREARVMLTLVAVMSIAIFLIFRVIPGDKWNRYSWVFLALCVPVAGVILYARFNAGANWIAASIIGFVMYIVVARIAMRNTGR
jgi:hypothetical protein